MRRAAEGLITALLLLGAAPLAAQQAPAASTDARSGDRQSLEELRPSGPITLALKPLFGDPGYANGALPLGPLSGTPFIVTGLLDAVACPLLS